MAKIKHIAMVTLDPERLAKFYQEVFDMKLLHRTETGGVFITDGYMTVALLPNKAEGKPNGLTFAYASSSLRLKTRRRLRALRERFVHRSTFRTLRRCPSAASRLAVGFFVFPLVATVPSPDVKYVLPVRFSEEAPAPALACSYVGVGDNRMARKLLHRTETGGVFITDGYMTVALLPNKAEGKPNGLNHFGFQIDDQEEIAGRLEDYGLAHPAKRPADRPYAETRATDPDGNNFDLSVHGFQKVEYSATRANKEPETVDA